MNHLEAQIKPEYVINVKIEGEKVTLILKNGFNFITKKIHFNDFEKFHKAVNSCRP